METRRNFLIGTAVFLSACRENQSDKPRKDKLAPVTPNPNPETALTDIVRDGKCEVLIYKNLESGAKREGEIRPIGCERASSRSIFHKMWFRLEHLAF